MTINSPRPCRAVNPSACPYHGAMLRMDDALANRDMKAYLVAKTDFDKAAEAKKQAVFNEILFPAQEVLPTTPADASYEYHLTQR